MRKVLMVLAIVLIASPCFAWQLDWEPVPTAEGYRVSWHHVDFPDQIQTNDVTVTTMDLENIGLVEGTRYEFFVHAFAGDPHSYSGSSDHLRWTYPRPAAIIEYMQPPQNPVINP